MSKRAKWVAGVVGAVTLAWAPSAALAVFPGENDKILFVSGTGDPANDDSDADLFINNLGDTTFTEAEAFADLLTGQRRHPAVSPDGNKIAFALKAGADGNIFIHDRAEGSTVQMWGSDNIDDDRPSWSPNNRFVAFESERSTAAMDQEYDIRIFDTAKPASVTNPINLTNSGDLHEGKPVWSPDGEFIYHSEGLSSPNEDIVRRPSGAIGVAATDIVQTGTASYQAALSPNGTQLCYTRGPFGSNTADIYIRSSAAGSAGSAGTDLSDTANGGFNCAWSPDGTRIAWVEGIFTQGALVSEPSSDGTATLLVDNTTDHFDGNPEYLRKSKSCMGQKASVIGTENADTLTAFEFKDVVQTLAEDDSARGKDGNDRMCGSGGDDVLRGGPDNDKLFGGGGNDTLIGNGGEDECFGGGGNDTFTNCEEADQ